jgi:hypothetical protein
MAGIETGMTPQDLTRICSEGIGTSDYRFQILLFLVNGLGQPMRPEAVDQENLGSLRDDCVAARERSA